MLYIRFVVTQIDDDSKQPQGVFICADALLKSGDLAEPERTELKNTLAWFNVNLPVPRKNTITGRATFWFRSSAQECIQRMWGLVNLLRQHDYLIAVHSCEHLHNVVYWDSFQVAAFPNPLDGPRIIK